MTIDREHSTTTLLSEREDFKQMLPTLVVDVAMPIVTFNVLTSHGVSTLWAAVAGGIFPAINNLRVWAKTRRLEPLGIIVMTFCVIGASAARKPIESCWLPLKNLQLRNQTAGDTIPGATIHAAMEGKSRTTKQPTPKERTLDIPSIVAELKRERDRLSRAIAALEGPDTAAAGTKRRVAAPQAATSSKKKRAGLTPAGRKRLSEAMKKRWAERRKKGS
jgi:hypothetical protein